MTDCPNAAMRDQLPDLLHERLDARAQRVVQAHLAACSECRAELELLRSIRAAAPMPRIDIARIAGAVRVPAPARRSVAGVWRLAAAITIMVIGGSSLVLVLKQASLSRNDSVATLANARGDGVELLGSEEYSQLNEGQLKALLHDIQQLDALPLIEPDVGAPVSLWPATGGME